MPTVAISAFMQAAIKRAEVLTNGFCVDLHDAYNAKECEACLHGHVKNFITQFGALRQVTNGRVDGGADLMWAMEVVWPLYEKVDKNLAYEQRYAIVAAKLAWMARRTKPSSELLQLADQFAAGLRQYRCTHLPALEKIQQQRTELRAQRKEAVVFSGTPLYAELERGWDHEYTRLAEEESAINKEALKAPKLSEELATLVKTIAGFSSDNMEISPGSALDNALSFIPDASAILGEEILLGAELPTITLPAPAPVVIPAKPQPKPRPKKGN